MQEEQARRQGKGDLKNVVCKSVYLLKSTFLNAKYFPQMFYYFRFAC